MDRDSEKLLKLADACESDAVAAQELRDLLLGYATEMIDVCRSGEANVRDMAIAARAFARATLAS